MGQVFVDDGACYGYCSLLAAELVGAAGKVLAFEPHPCPALPLWRTLALSGMEGWSQVEEVALAGPESGWVMRLVLPEGSPLNAHLLPEELAGGGGGPGTVRGPGMAMVATRALDRHARVKPDVMKLDLCGAEEAAFAGMQGVIEANPAVQVLLCCNPVRSAAPADFLGRLAGQFRLRRLTARGEAQDCTPAEAMGSGDVMLYLAR